MNKIYCIIGTSAGGIGAAQKLRQLDSQATIICISDEQDVPYNKCMLADYAAGIKGEDSVHTLSSEQAAQKNIIVMLGKKVIAIDNAHKRITLHDGQFIAYDSLLLAVGTSPIIPAIKGIDSQGVFTFHRLADIVAIKQYVKIRKPNHAVIIGSGLSGLECADALQVQGFTVTVIERNEHVLSSLVNQQGASYIQQKFVQAGGSLFIKRTVKEIQACDGVVIGVLLDDGSCVAADMVVIAAGISPNLELADSLELAVHERAGIVVDEHMRTSQSTIFAAGDCVVVKDLITHELVPSRTWPDAMLQGITAAHAMAGQSKPYQGVAAAVSSSFFGIKFARLGALQAANGQQVIEHITDEYYHRFIVHDGILKGFLLVGDTSLVGTLRMAILTKTQITQEILSPGRH